jgi:hypothetical protein
VALDASKQVLGREVNSEDNAKLVSDFADEVKEGKTRMNSSTDEKHAEALFELAQGREGKVADYEAALQNVLHDFAMEPRFGKLPFFLCSPQRGYLPPD